MNKLEQALVDTINNKETTTIDTKLWLAKELLYVLDDFRWNALSRADTEVIIKTVLDKLKW